MKTHSAIIGGILSIVHPKQYLAGTSSLKVLHQQPEHVIDSGRLKEILNDWSTPFQAISIISNRITPPHRDTKGVKRWMDILVAVGAYQTGWLGLRGLGVKFDYAPGTVIAMPGRVLTHAAECDGDRACIAYYMRENVTDRLWGKTGTWATLEDI